MKRTRLSTLLLMLTFISSILVLVSCGNGGGNNGNGPTPTPPAPAKLTAPAVVLTDDTASWSANASADKFEISIDGVLSFLENTVTSKKLTDGQSFKIRAIGDGVNYTSSDWSNSVTYVKPKPPVSDETYTVIWKNGDTVLEVDENVKKGTTPAFNGAEPTKEADAQYRYTFIGWSPEISAVTSDVIYSAQFEERALNKYTVTWKNGDEILKIDRDVEYGTLPVYDGAVPQKPSDAEFSYTFIGWSPKIVEVNGDATYTAIFSAHSPNLTYTVIFNDWDGTEISRQAVEHGQSAVPPVEPERDGYRFDGWDKEYSYITGDITITAKYQATVLVQFIDYDGTIIYSEYIDQGDDFINLPQEPSRSNYAFDGWSTTEFTNIVEDLVIYAQYVRTYKVTFKDHDGTILKSENVKTGEAATAPNPPSREGYTFIEWDSNFDSITANTTITATYQINKYTVTFVGSDGKILSVVENVKYGFPVIAPEVEDNYFNWTTLKGYEFTGWDKPYSVITGDTTITATYDKEITEPIIVVRNETVSSGETAESEISICSNQKIYGISLDMTFDKALQQGGKDITIDVRNTFGDMNVKYTSKLTDECTYELRWVDGDGIDPTTLAGHTMWIFTFKFGTKDLNKGYYLIDILESTYLIDENLTKVTPVVISGTVTISD